MAESLSEMIDERLNRIQTVKGVKGLLVCTFKTSENKDEVGSGAVQIIKSTMPPGEMTSKYAKNMAELAQQARFLVRDLDPSNDLTFLRIKCKKHEMMVAPDKAFYLVVIQAPDEEENPAPQRESVI